MRVRNLNKEMKDFARRYMGEIILESNMDKDLAFCFRDNCAQVYYKGINILQIYIKNKEFQYEISAGIFRFTYTSLKKNEGQSQTRISKDLEEMLEIRKKLKISGWHLQWYLSSRNKIRQMKIYQDFAKKHNRKNHTYFDSEIDEWIKLLWLELKDDRNSWKDLSMTFHFLNLDMNSNPKFILNSWLQNLKYIKRAVNIYFDNNRVQREKILQNYLFRYMPITQLIPIDLEYNPPSIDHKETKGRADIVALSDDYVLNLIEVKLNEGSLGPYENEIKSSKSGMISHTKDFQLLTSQSNINQLQILLKDIKIINDLRNEFNTQPYLINSDYRIDKINYIMLFGYEESIAEIKLNKIKKYMALFLSKMFDYPKYVKLENKKTIEINAKAILVEISDLELSNYKVNNLVVKEERYV